MKKILALLATVSSILVTGCATNTKPVYPIDDAGIRSVLILPIINETSQVGAGPLMNAFSTMPLAERGYYTYPPETVRFVLEAEGLYEPEKAQEVTAEKFASMFGTDLVVYAKILKWDSEYLVVNTRNIITVQYKVFDRQGQELWGDTLTSYYDTNQGNSGSLAGLLVNMVSAAIARGVQDLRPQARFAADRVAYVFAPGPYAVDSQAQ